jgi:hypothetical protein
MGSMPIAKVDSESNVINVGRHWLDNRIADALRLPRDEGMACTSRAETAREQNCHIPVATVESGMAQDVPGNDLLISRSL